VGQCSCAIAAEETARKRKSAAVGRTNVLLRTVRSRHEEAILRTRSVPVDIEDSLVVTYTIAQ
jgi:hypothetical protein